MNALIHNENVERVLKLLPKGITIILAVILAVMLASLFWLLVTPKEEQPTPAITQTPENVPPVTVTHYGQMIANQHIFGKVDKAKPVVPKKVTPPVTRLNLVLHGIVARKGRKSYAIIANGKAKQGIYAVGEEPQSGVKIDSILPRKVILRHGGKLEELALPEKVKASRSNNHLPPVNTIASPHLNPVGMSPSEVSGGNKLPENDLGALRDALTNNPDKILEIASITESKDQDGNLIGFRLSPGKNRKLFRKLGLRPGDIVTEVNGVVLDSPAKGLMIMNELSSAASISITVKRGDQEVSIQKPF